MSIPKKVMLTLYCWGAGTSLCVAGRLFGIGLTTVCQACLDVADTLSTILFRQAVCFPAQKDAVAWEVIKKGFFEKQNIDSIAGTSLVLF